MRQNPDDRVVTAVVTYGYYGCESGCDGYDIIGYDARGKEIRTGWAFDYWHEGNRKGETREQFATRLARDEFGAHVTVDMTRSHVEES